jgi:hypothetical protein
MDPVDMAVADLAVVDLAVVNSEVEVVLVDSVGLQVLVVVVVAVDLVEVVAFMEENRTKSV